MDEITQTLKLQWNINIEQAKLIPVGFFQMSWKIEDTAGNKYFLKVFDFNRHIVNQKDLENKLLHFEYLSKKVDFIPALIKTKDNQIYYISSGKLYILQSYLEIINIDDIDPRRVIPLLIKIHNVKILDNHKITENFQSNLTQIRYRNTLKLIKELIKTESFYDKSYFNLLETRLNRYLQLRKVINKDDLCYIHKDPFGNVVETMNGLFMVDWDDITISNPEADIWFLVDRQSLIKMYENLSKREVKIQECEYYALESFFLYYDAYAVKFFGNQSLKVKKEVVSGIKRGIFGWFESIYSNF